jgi:hypothetical protein
MNDNYLWDRSGVPDAEIERMEQALEPFRHRVRPARVPRVRWTAALAAAAAVVLAALMIARTTVAPVQPAAWQVASLEGTARLGSGSARVDMPVRPGQVLTTGGGSAVTLESEPVGRIDLGPDSELHASAGRTVTLERGTLHAFIWAPPREFVVETPSARAVDLGCEYTLEVDHSGGGLLRVSMGWVAFQYDGHEAFIPAGAECFTSRQTGPGIPFYEDAPPRFRAGLENWNKGGLGDVLAEARQRDGLTLWHLLTRVPPAERAAVFDRFAQLVPLPPEVAREAAIRGDPHTIDLCWNALNLENTSWWRGWERVWK